jgi:hypothetical protein
MRCPNCDHDIEIEDYADDEEFECESCHVSLRLETDEGSYCGAAVKHLVVQDDD